MVIHINIHNYIIVKHTAAIHALGLFQTQLFMGFSSFALSFIPSLLSPSSPAQCYFWSLCPDSHDVNLCKN